MEPRKKIGTSRMAAAIDAMAEKGFCKERVKSMMNKGSPGAYSEAAALKAYPKCETVPCDKFEDVFEVVDLWLVEKAVLPIENSLGGSIHRNYDLLLRHRLHIVGEVKLAVNHCLLGLPGIKKEELKKVLSHPQVYLMGGDIRIVDKEVGERGTCFRFTTRFTLCEITDHRVNRWRLLI